jgi:hypothetical protein
MKETPPWRLATILEQRAATGRQNEQTVHLSIWREEVP